MITASMLRLPRFAPFTAKTPAQRNSRSGPNLSTVATLTSRAPPAIPAMLIIEIPPTDPSTAAMRTTALAGGGATEAIESGKAEPDGAHADRTEENTAGASEPEARLKSAGKTKTAAPTIRLTPVAARANGPTTRVRPASRAAEEAGVTFPPNT